MSRMMNHGTSFTPSKLSCKQTNSASINRRAHAIFICFYRNIFGKFQNRVATGSTGSTLGSVTGVTVGDRFCWMGTTKSKENERRANEVVLYECQRGRLGKIKEAVDDVKSSINAKNLELKTPLILASANGHLNIVKYILGKLSSRRSIRNMVAKRDKHRRTALLWAAYKGHLSIVRFLVEEHKANVNIRDIFGCTPLTWAASKGDINIVEYLVEHGKAEVDKRDYVGKTALIHATESGQLEAIQYLIEVAKANVEMRDIHGTALFWAAANDNVDIFQYLVEVGKADIEAKCNANTTPISMASRRIHTSQTSKVLDYLANQRFLTVLTRDVASLRMLQRSIIAAINGHDLIDLLFNRRRLYDVNHKK